MESVAASGSKPQRHAQGSGGFARGAAQTGSWTRARLILSGSPASALAQVTSCPSMVTNLWATCVAEASLSAAIAGMQANNTMTPHAGVAQRSNGCINLHPVPGNP